MKRSNKPFPEEFVNKIINRDLTEQVKKNLDRNNK